MRWAAFAVRLDVSVRERGIKVDDDGIGALKSRGTNSCCTVSILERWTGACVCVALIR